MNEQGLQNQSTEAMHQYSKLAIEQSATKVLGQKRQHNSRNIGRMNKQKNLLRIKKDYI